tara:strand:- start:433 stop:756 length:324 start_codon:yes stop_codon:yes gene_type:complete
MIFEGLLNAPSTAHGARSAAATKLRRSRCCDEAAQTSSVALILRVAYGADAAATELMLRAPRSAAATELRRSRCCDGAAQTSSVALILRVASRRDALNEEPASFPPG